MNETPASSMHLLARCKGDSNEDQIFQLPHNRTRLRANQGACRGARDEPPEYVRYMIRIPVDGASNDDDGRAIVLTPIPARESTTSSCAGPSLQPGRPRAQHRPAAHRSRRQQQRILRRAAGEGQQAAWRDRGRAQGGHLADARPRVHHADRRLAMPVIKAIAGHTGCQKVKTYLEKRNRALARDFFNPS